MTTRLAKLVSSKGMHGLSTWDLVKYTYMQYHACEVERETLPVSFWAFSEGSAFFV